MLIVQILVLKLIMSSHLNSLIKCYLFNYQRQGIFVKCACVSELVKKQLLTYITKLTQSSIWIILIKWSLKHWTGEMLYLWNSKISQSAVTEGTPWVLYSCNIESILFVWGSLDFKCPTEDEFGVEKKYLVNFFS